MKPLATLLFILPYALLTGAIRATVNIYTVSKEDVTLYVDAHSGGMFGNNPYNSERETTYEIETPLANNNNICVDLRKDLGRNPRTAPREIMLAFSLWYNKAETDPDGQRYDEPIAIAFWKKLPSLLEGWFLLLAKWQRLSDHDINMGHCLGEPDLLLTFKPNHDNIDEEEFFHNFVMLPSDKKWLKDYRHFLFIGATDDDLRYKAWRKSVKKQKEAKNFLDWVYW